MDIQKQLAMAAVAKAHKRNGTTPPPSVSATKTKAPIKTGADPKQSSKAKNAAAAALASRLGGGAPRGPPPAAASKGNDAILEKYRKMVKMGVPAGAIRGKMSAEGIPPKVIDDVLSGGGGSAPAGGSSSRRPGPHPPPGKITGGGASSLSPKEEQMATQYRKMAKLGMPPGAIRHKMTSDGVSQKIQDSVLAGEVPGGSSSGGSSSSRPAPTSSGRAPASAVGGAVSKLSPKEEKIATQYRKMVKLGSPAGAVRHKMVSDGVAQTIQDSVLGGETPASESAGQASRGGGGGGSSRAPASSEAGGSVSKLSSKEEQVATQYRKMVKMGLPDGAIIHKMSMDGVAKNIQTSVLAKEVPATQVETSGPSQTSASAFTAGAASLKISAPRQAPAATSSGGSPLAIAAAAAAAQRKNGPKKAPRQVPQNPVPQKAENASGPGGLAAAAVAAAASRTKRQNANPMEQADGKSTPHKVNAKAKQMVALKPRPVPATSSQTPKPRSTPAPRPRSDPSPRGSSSARAQTENSATQRRAVPASTTPSRRAPSPAPTPTPSPQMQAVAAPIAPVVIEPMAAEAPPNIPKLDPDEEEVADHYRGLVHDGKTLDAVREEMISDGAPPHIQEAVLVTFAPPPTPPPPVAPMPTTAHPMPVSDMEFDEVEEEIFEEFIEEEIVEEFIEEEIFESASPPPTNRAIVPKAVDPEVNPIPVVTPPAKDRSPPVTLLDQDPKFKKRSEEAVSEPAPSEATKKKKKKQRKKTAKGTTVLESGAEQHCACTIM